MTREMFKVKFESKAVTDFLKDAAKKLSDLTPLMKTARVFLKNTVDEDFETEGTHTGDKWKPWSESWKKRRIQMGRGSGRILNLEGVLRRSIKAYSNANEAGVGTNIVYAAAHNFGFKGKVSKKSKLGKKFTANMFLPKREFMRISEHQKELLQADLYIKLKEILLEKDVNKKVFGG